MEKELSPYQQRKREYNRKFHKLWRIREKEKIKIQRHDYYEKNKKEIKNVTKTYYETHREQIFKQRKELKEKRRTELEIVIGNKCIVCGSTKHIVFHEIHGKKHPLPRGDSKRIHFFMLEHKEDFVPLCFKCHSTIHYLAFQNREKAIELIRITSQTPHY